jgi:hypothetical protein
MIKPLFLTLILLTPKVVSGQDPREFNHGSCIVEYKNINDSIKYYLTWSSAFNNGWEHDIYNSTVFFDNKGNLISETQDQVFISSNEAQEPVNAAINPANNYILSSWEDGVDTDGPNIRGQIHTPNGTVIKSNWIIAGGTGSQHSASVAHLYNMYLIFYADEAPPSTGGAVVKCKVIDDITGVEKQSIQFTPNNEDHWWPVSVSNKSNSRTLIVWGNDGYATMGGVLYNNNGEIQQSLPPQDYLINTQQYFYQVEWLEELSKFILIARNGAYENMTDESQICIIDTMGNICSKATITGGIVREAKMAVKWSQLNQTYSVYYPSGLNDLVKVTIDNLGNISPSTTLIDNHLDLRGVKWPSTGIWSTFVTNVNGNDLFQNQYVALFIMNDTLSNNIIKVAVHLDGGEFIYAPITQ